jgi:hypothetical protein
VIVLTTRDDSQNWKAYSDIPFAVFVEREFLFTSIMRQEISVLEFQLRGGAKETKKSQPEEKEIPRTSRGDTATSRKKQVEEDSEELEDDSEDYSE